MDVCQMKANPFKLIAVLNSGAHTTKHDVKYQATISVYDALGKLPLSNLSYESVLKPLIDLDYVSQTKSGWMNVGFNVTFSWHLLNANYVFGKYDFDIFIQFLSNVAVDADLRKTANDIKKNWGAGQVKRNISCFVDLKI